MNGGIISMPNKPLEIRDNTAASGKGKHLEEPILVAIYRDNGVLVGAAVNGGVVAQGR